MIGLDELMTGLSYQWINKGMQWHHKAQKALPNELKVRDLAYDSRKAGTQMAFVALHGCLRDGNDYIIEALTQGAVAVVTDQRPSQECLKAWFEVQPECCVVWVLDARKALGHMSAQYFANPALNLTFIGVTGTKGKTTVAMMLWRILKVAGIKAGMVGTLGIFDGETLEPSLNTTPESYELQKAFRQMAEQGCTHVVMEVSSQGLKMSRVEGLRFKLGIFTNLSMDHIGPLEHAHMTEYAQWKRQLFNQSQLGIFNGDDKYCEEITRDVACDLRYYSMKKACDYQGEQLQLFQKGSQLGVTFGVKPRAVSRTASKEEAKAVSCKVFQVQLPLLGAFNGYNALAAAAAALELGIAPNQIQKALSDIHIPGRTEIIPVGQCFTVVVDYAHNGESLKQLLSELRAYEPRRLICIFGCGGNRSKKRRQLMGQAANASDFTIITSDNPRDEPPMAIIEDIEKGLRDVRGHYVVVIDRREAIAYGLRLCRHGDILVIAGKGHENYQEIKGVKYPFNDRQVLEEILANTP